MKTHALLHRLQGLALTTAIATSSPASATERVQVEDVRTLMLAAIQAPDGRAQGTLSGRLAQAITQKFEGTSPIFVDVSTERRFAQADCSRLNLRIWQEGVRLPGATEPRRQTIDFGINYCSDGKPPRTLR